MPVSAKLKKLLDGFEKLQVKYARLGAHDNEPDHAFQWLIRKAVLALDVDWANLRWALHKGQDGAEAAAAELTAQARLVYDHVRGHASEDDVRWLADYCWRLL